MTRTEDPSPVTVLLVDDNEEILSAISRILTDAGFLVVISNSPFGASSLVQKHEPKVVILDVMMPALDGVALAKFIAKQRVGETPHIILFSALPEEELYRMAKGIPGASYVQKTDGPTELIKAVRRLTA